MVPLFNRLDAQGGAAQHVARQLFAAGTSVGANYEEAAAGQTKADFIAKIAIARKECREALFWLTFIRRAGLLPDLDLAADISEAKQLTSILTAIIMRSRESSRRG
jgi:four helix bundle protein